MRFRFAAFAPFAAFAALLFVGLVLAHHVAGAQHSLAPQPSAANRAAKVDALFAAWTRDTPGCSVGVAAGGAPVLAKGYGMADLEHNVSITPDTIFEAGSVSKQFTAAAILLLARDRKLSLDDPVRTYIPELPDYPLLAATNSPVVAGTPSVSLTIRHMLTHTSGLRDWGAVESIAGWPRTTRAYTHAHVLEIVSRQKALNFTPGTRWSYSNTGYNLAAMIVERVSGQTLQAFTHARLFVPLGMTHTSWRDDFTQIVKGRAMAYTLRDGAYHSDMPFENVYGNGGLLTTVGDLLKWNAHFDARSKGDPLSVHEQQTPGTFNDGRPHGYALGLFIGKYRGVREVYHSGSTAGYNAFLTRFPDRHLSIAVLCNSTTAPATRYAHGVADAYLDDPLDQDIEIAPYVLSDADRGRLAGLYRDDDTGTPLTIALDGDRLRIGRAELLARSATQFFTDDGATWAIDAHGLRRTDAFGTVVGFVREKPAHLTAAQLARYAGDYVSDEADSELHAAVEHGALVLTRRPGTKITLDPLYGSAFSAGSLGTVFFESASPGRANVLIVSQDRVWKLRFERRH